MTIPNCVFGDAKSTTTVVLYGDSHAAQWFPTLERIAATDHWRLVSLTKSGCSPVDVEIWNWTFQRPYTECDTWRSRAIGRIESERPSLIVVSTSHIYDLSTDAGQVKIAQRPDLWDAGLAQTMGSLSSSGAKVAFLGDTPRPGVDVPKCLADHLDNAVLCATAVTVAINIPESETEATIVLANAGVFIDPGLWVCPTDPCPAVIGRYLVYRDNSHLTTPFAVSLAPRLLHALPQLGQ